MAANVDPEEFARLYGLDLHKTCSSDDLIRCAAGILAIVARAKNDGPFELEHKSVALQRALIALVARGGLPEHKLEDAPLEAFTGAPRLFAWTCACHAARVTRKHVSFFWVRYALHTSKPLDLAPGYPSITKADVKTFVEEHGQEAAEQWLLGIGRDPEPGTMAGLWRETEAELDAAQAMPAPSNRALADLLADLRNRRTREWLDPIVVALAQGKPLVDTATRLRQGAELFEGT